MRKIITGNFLYFVVIVLFIAIQLCFSSLYRDLSHDADTINEEYQNISLKTQTLEAKIADLSSLASVEKRAKKLGFVPATDMIYLTSSNVLAKTR